MDIPIPEATVNYSKLLCGHDVYKMMATKKTRLGELGLMVQGIVEAETRLSAANLQSKVKRDFRAFGARIVSRQLSKDKTFLAPCDQDYFIEKLQIATKDKFAQLFNTVMINVKLKFNESAIAQFKSETSKQTRIIVEDAKIDYQRASIVTDIGRRWKSTFCHADFYNQVRTQLAMRLQPTDEDAVTLSLPEAAQTDLLFETTTTGASSTSTRLPLSNVANSLPASAPSRLPFENIDTIPPSNPLHLPLSNVADSADKLSFSSAQPQARKRKAKLRKEKMGKMRKTTSLPFNIVVLILTSIMKKLSAIHHACHHICVCLRTSTTTMTTMTQQQKLTTTWRPVI